MCKSTASSNPEYGAIIRHRPDKKTDKTPDKKTKQKKQTKKQTHRFISLFNFKRKAWPVIEGAFIAAKMGTKLLHGHSAVLNTTKNEFKKI